MNTAHRTLEICWRPRSRAEWQTFGSCRREAARLWNEMTETAYLLRCLNWPWMTKQEWRDWAKSMYPLLHSGSVQEIIDEFLEALDSARVLRKKGAVGARYPKPGRRRYRTVPYKNTQARFRNGALILPNVASGNLSIRLPAGMVADDRAGRLALIDARGLLLEGRMMECRLEFDRVLIVLKVELPAVEPGATVGIDLGVNTLIAATDGETAILVSGRSVKSAVRQRNKRLGQIARLQSKKKRGSRRWRRLQAAKRRMLSQAKRRIKSFCHKATRQIADEFPGATAYIGKPFNEAAQHLPRRQAQTVSQATTATLTKMLGYKLGGATSIDEHYTSQTCPVCGERHRCQRTYRCGCGVTAPRDVVGSLNMLDKGRGDTMGGGTPIPKKIKYLRPFGRSSPGNARQVARGESAGSAVGSTAALDLSQSRENPANGG